MDKQLEKILIGLAFVALAALVIANVRQPAVAVADLPAEDYNANETTGPLYLLGNMPWAYMPWVGNAIPQATTGQVGQSADLTQGAIINGNCFNGGC